MSAGWTEADIQNLSRNQAAVAQPIRAKGRVHVPGTQNKGETAYDAHLALEKRLGEIVYYDFEAITLKLADGVRYTPDFLVMRPNGQMECHEVKGKKVFKRDDGSVIRVGAYMQEDARIKIAMAAKQFPFTFIMVWPGTNGEWDSKEY